MTPTPTPDAVWINLSICRILRYLFTMLLLASSCASAATAVYVDKPAWERSVGARKVIDFSVDVNGAPLTTPAADKYFENLFINGASFSPIQSYYNQAIYAFPGSAIRATFPKGTTSFAADLSPFYDYAEGYTIRISIAGQVQDFTRMRQRIPYQYDFFGFTSTENIDWVEFRHPVGYITLDNLWYSKTNVYTDRPRWADSVRNPFIIDFSVDNNGVPLTSPATDKAFENLRLQGASFSPVQSY